MKISNLIKHAFLIVVALASVNAVASTDEGVASRLMPAGNVCVEGVECTTANVVASAKADKNSPEAMFKGKCNSCHGTGVGGAPIVGDADAWGPRITKGIDALYLSGLNGVPGTVMMAKGGFTALSDDEVKGIVDYMVEQSQ
ncbi:c-type cytochrome [Marinicellulosiphila megalodicopiae]|uniref:c-type cytochrome n=1 Tax=Marinicellulosiphila megalodicopiae TaxID=2724896 RepID=UPI003BB1ABF6